jgi:dipeptidyl aminopeptidase/acylaminoacyl peptidase
MTRPMRPSDIGLLRQVTDVTWHPDGSRLGYVVSWVDLEADANRSQIWLHDAGRSVPLTHGHQDGSPRFSPDGHWLAFLRSWPRGGPQTQVWMLPVEGGEATAVTDMADGVEEVTWLPDSSGLVVAASVRPPDQVGVDDEELARRPRRIRTPRYRYNGRGFAYDRRIQLHRVELPAEDGSLGAAVALTDAEADHGDAVVAPEGGRIAWTVTGCRADAPGADQHLVVGAVDGSDPEVWAGGDEAGGSWHTPAWTQDGTLYGLGHAGDRIAFDRLHRLGPGGVELVDPDDVNRENLLGGGAGLVLQGGSAFVLAIRAGAVQVDRIALDGSGRETVLGGNRSVLAFDVSASGRLAAVVADLTSPAELWVDGEAVTDHGRIFLAEVALAPTEEITVKSADGYEVQAFVTVPTEGAGPHPGLVYVHGGPMAQYGYTIFDEFQVAAACGYVVIGGNPRGSDGFGEEHAACIAGHLGEPDWSDVQAIADALAARPDVDAERIGIGGGSYGGWMTSWAIGHTDRFEAALVERAVTCWETFAGTSDIGTWFGRIYGADRTTDLDATRRQSPLTYVDGIHTPTLIVHSEEDWRCPIEQAEQLFAALAVRGVDTELVRFPGENHELSRSGRPSRRIERFQIIHEFFARRLGGRHVP